MGAGACAGVTAAVSTANTEDLLKAFQGLAEADKSKILQALNSDGATKSLKNKARLSFTADLGGVVPGVVQPADVLPFEGTWAPGDPVQVEAPDLKDYHEKVGEIVKDLGMTPNGPRIAVKFEGMEDEVQMPPVCLVRVIKEGETPADGEKRSSAKRLSNSMMRADGMSGQLEFIPFNQGAEGQEPEELDSARKEE